jgi:hypothetical protein
VDDLDRRKWARRKVPDENGGDRIGRDATERKHRGPALETKGWGGVEGLDRRRAPGSEQPDENSGAGRMWDAAGGGWGEYEGSGSEAAGRFEIHGGWTEGRRWGWGGWTRGKNKKRTGAGRRAGEVGEHAGCLGLPWGARVWNSYSIPRV